MTEDRQTVLITGASGFLGSNLVEFFKRKNFKIICLVRSPKKHNDDSVVFVKYDLTKPLDPKVFEGVDYLIHAAYVKYSSKNPEAYDINLKAAQDLMNASRRYKLKKNIFISSMSAHEEAESVYGKQKLAIEKVFSGKQDLVLRCGLILGNGGIVKQMATFMKTKHIVPVINGGGQPLQIIAVYDLVKVIENGLKSNATGVYTVATPQIYSYKQFYRALANRLSVKVLFIPIPLSLLSLMLDIVNVLHLPLSVSKDNLLGLKMLKAVDNKKDMVSLGVKPDSLDEALKNTQIT